MNNIIVSPSPHIRDEKTTQGIMIDVCIALVPALIASVLYFGYKSLVLSALCVLFCVGFEYLWQKLTKKSVTISDGTAVVTGLLLAFNLPVSAPWWICLIGSFVAIIIVKQFFGGVGNNGVHLLDAAFIGELSLEGSVKSRGRSRRLKRQNRRCRRGRRHRQ